MIRTRRVRRPLRAVESESALVPTKPQPGSPREIARKMALEGAIRLARHGALPATAPLVPLIEPVPLSRPRHGPFAAFRPAVRPIVAAIALLLTATSIRAQVASASPVAMGPGDNFTAAARGVDAVAWNASVLGLSGASFARPIPTHGEVAAIGVTGHMGAGNGR